MMEFFAFGAIDTILLLPVLSTKRDKERSHHLFGLSFSSLSTWQTFVSANRPHPLDKDIPTDWVCLELRHMRCGSKQLCKSQSTQTLSNTSWSHCTPINQYQRYSQHHTYHAAHPFTNAEKGRSFNLWTRHLRPSRADAGRKAPNSSQLNQEEQQQQQHQHGLSAYGDILQTSHALYIYTTTTTPTPVPKQTRTLPPTAQ